MNINNSIRKKPNALCSILMLVGYEVLFVVNTYYSRNIH